MSTVIVGVGMATIFAFTVLLILWALGIVDIHVSVGKEEEQ